MTLFDSCWEEALALSSETAGLSDRLLIGERRDRLS